MNRKLLRHPLAVWLFLLSGCISDRLLNREAEQHIADTHTQQVMTKSSALDAGSAYPYPEGFAELVKTKDFDNLPTGMEELLQERS